MWFKVEINTDEILRVSFDEARSFLKDKAQVVKEWVDSLTPEREKVLLKNNKISDVVRNWLRFSIKVYNETLYAIFVEYWVMWKIYNYHKPAWKIFFSWIWAAMFRKTWFKYKDSFNFKTK